MEHPFIAMLRKNAEEGADERRQWPLWEAQLGTLREVQALAGDNPREFLRGDIVRYIAQTGPMVKPQPEGMCLMFWRMLDPEALDDQRRIGMISASELGHLDEIDCLLMLFDGQCVHFYLGATSLLERDPRQDTVKCQ